MRRTSNEAGLWKGCGNQLSFGIRRARASEDRRGLPGTATGDAGREHGMRSRVLCHIAPASWGR